MNETNSKSSSPTEFTQPVSRSAKKTVSHLQFTDVNQDTLRLRLLACKKSPMSTQTETMISSKAFLLVLPS